MGKKAITTRVILGDRIHLAGKVWIVTAMRPELGYAICKNRVTEDKTIFEVFDYQKVARCKPLLK